MYGAAPTVGLMLSEPAVVEATAGIVGQPPVFLGRDTNPQTMAAIERNHLPDGLLVVVYSAHRKKGAYPKLL